MIADHTDLSVAGMTTPCQVQRLLAGYSAGEVMVPSQGTNEEEWMVLPADHSLARWASPSEVQEKHCLLNVVHWAQLFGS